VGPMHMLMNSHISNWDVGRFTALTSWAALLATQDQHESPPGKVL
jgi:hypothetical protein